MSKQVIMGCVDTVGTGPMWVFSIMGGIATGGTPHLSPDIAITTATPYYCTKVFEDGGTLSPNSITYLGYIAGSPVVGAIGPFPTFFRG